MLKRLSVGATPPLKIWVNIHNRYSNCEFKYGRAINVFSRCIFDFYRRLSVRVSLCFAREGNYARLFDSKN